MWMYHTVSFDYVNKSWHTFGRSRAAVMNMWAQGSYRILARSRKRLCWDGYNFFTIHGNNSKFVTERLLHVYLCNKNNDAIIIQ